MCISFSFILLSLVLVLLLYLIWSLVRGPCRMDNSNFKRTFYSFHSRKSLCGIAFRIFALVLTSVHRYIRRFERFLIEDLKLPSMWRSSMPEESNFYPHKSSPKIISFNKRSTKLTRCYDLSILLLLSRLYLDFKSLRLSKTKK